MVSSIPSDPNLNVNVPDTNVADTNVAETKSTAAPTTGQVITPPGLPRAWSFIPEDPGAVSLNSARDVNRPINWHLVQKNRLTASLIKALLRQKIYEMQWLANSVGDSPDPVRSQQIAALMRPHVLYLSRFVLAEIHLLKSFDYLHRPNISPLPNVQVIEKPTERN